MNGWITTCDIVFKIKCACFEMFYRQLTWFSECYYIRRYETTFYIIISMLPVYTKTTMYNLIIYSY